MTSSLRRAGLVGSLPLVAAVLAATTAGSAGAAPPPPDDPQPPPVQDEPSPPTELEHPVVVHDCDTDAGYSVTSTISGPADAELDIHRIEVYQTSSDHSYGYHPIGAADVYVHADDRPQSLVLHAYEPTLWRIHADPGVQLASVVVEGFNPQQIEISATTVGTVVLDGTTVSAGPLDDDTIDGEPSIDDGDPPAASSTDTYCYDASLFSVFDRADVEGTSDDSDDEPDTPDLPWSD